MESVLIGDLHLDKMTPIFGDAANKMIMHEVSRVLEYALDNDINHAVILGDVCNTSRMSYNAQLAFLDTLDRWAGRGITLDCLLGNHDQDEDGVHSLEVISRYANKVYPFFRVHSTESGAIDVGGVDCHFLAWPRSKPKTIKRRSLAFGHFEVSGSVADNGREIKEGADVDPDVPTFCGHLHTPHEVRNVHYVGTLYQTSFGEHNQKSFTHLKARYSKGKLQTKAVRIAHEAVFQLRTLVIKTPKDLRVLIDRDGAEYKANPLWKYKLVLKDDVEIPDTFLMEHENIIKVNGFKTKADLDSILTEDWVSATEGELSINPGQTLQDMLLDKYKLKPKRVKKAMTFLKGLTT